jgi:ABC-2 type transport system ATP-binding protein
MSAAIETFHLTKVFRGAPVVSDLTFSVSRGEVVGLVGPNGAGKSVTMRMLAGLMSPTSGEFALSGELSPYSKGKRPSVAYLSQTMDFPPDHTLGRLLDLCRSFSPTWDQPFCDELADRFRLSSDLVVSDASVGQKLQVGILCAFSQGANVLLLDEPAGNLDPLARANLGEAIALALDSNGPALFIATHLLGSLERMVDRILLLSSGRLLHELRMEEFVENYRRLQVVFPSEPPESFTIPGALCCRASVRSYEAVLPRAVPEAVQTICDPLGAKWSLYPLTLEELFVSLYGRTKQ